MIDPRASPEVTLLNMWRRLLRWIDLRIKEQLATARIDAGQLVGELPPDMGGGAAALDDLTDVDTATDPPESGESLVWSGVEWVPGVVTGYYALAPLEYNGEALTYDGDPLLYGPLVEFSIEGHDHNDLYYTEAETDALLAGKSDSGHSHTEFDELRAMSWMGV